MFLISICYGTPFILLEVRGDTFTSHLKPITDGTLDIGTATLYWRYIYGDAFTDGTFTVTGGIVTGATWEGVPIDISDFTNLVAGVNITLADDTLNVDDAFLINDGDDTTTGTITAAGFTDGTFIVTGGIITAGTWQGTAIDISGYTNLIAGTNITLVDDTLNVDDAFLINDGDDTTTGIITSAGFTTTGAVTAGASTFGTATHRTDFGNRGAMTMYGDARVEKHIVIGAASFRKGGVAPTESFQDIFPTLKFQDNRLDAAHYTAWVPYTWDNTTDMEVHVHWQHENADAGQVKWHLRYIGLDHGEDPAGAGTEIVQITAGGHAADSLISTTFTTKILATNLARDDDLGLKLWRDGVDAGDDTMTEDAELIAVHIHFTMNQLGQPGLVPVTDVLLLDGGVDKLLLSDGASFLLIRI